MQIKSVLSHDCIAFDCLNDVITRWCVPTNHMESCTRVIFTGWCTAYVPWPFFQYVHALLLFSTLTVFDSELWVLQFFTMAVNSWKTHCYNSIISKVFMYFWENVLPVVILPHFHQLIILLHIKRFAHWLKNGHILTDNLSKLNSWPRFYYSGQAECIIPCVKVTRVTTPAPPSPFLFYLKQGNMSCQCSRPTGPSLDNQHKQPFTVFWWEWHGGT